MKKTLLAVVLPALISTGANAVEIFNSEQGSVDFYGQLRTEILKGSGEATNLTTNGSRAGITAQYTVKGDLFVHGRYEFGLPGDSVDSERDSLNSRLHYAGIGGDWGKLSFGKQYTLQEDFYGADFSYYFGGSVIRYTPFSSYKHESMVKYELEGEGFKIAAAYGLDEDQAHPKTSQLFASADAGNFDFIAGVALDEGYTEQEGTSDEEKLETLALTASVGYTFEKAYVQSTYYRSEYKFFDANDFTVTENAFSIAASYDWMESSSLYTGFEYVTFDQLDAAKAIDSAATDNSKVFYVGNVYHLNDWSRVWVEYGYGDGTTLGYKNKESGKKVTPTIADAENSVGIGFRVYW